VKIQLKMSSPDFTPGEKKHANFTVSVSHLPSSLCSR